VTFTERDLRRGLDVFSLDNVYLGTVIWIRWDENAFTPDPSPVREGGKHAVPVSPLPRTGEGLGVGVSFSGERLGPMPTSSIGNSGPVRQASATKYATQTVGPGSARVRRPAELLIFRWLVSLNWATARPVLRRVPAGLIHLISLERIILSVNASEMP